MNSNGADGREGERASGCARDVSSAEAEREAKYRYLYRKTPAMMHSIDRSGRLVSVSDMWLTRLGYDESEVLGRKSTDFLTEASKNHAERVVLPEFFRTGKCENVAYQVVKKDGTIIDVLLSATAERDETGAIVRSLAVLVEVTEHLRAIEALRESEQRFQDLLNGVEGVAWEAHADTLQFSFVSLRAESILGYPEPRWFEPGFWLGHVHSDDRGLVEEAIAAALRGARGSVEYRIVSARGDAVWIRDRIAAVAQSTAPVMLRGVMIDVSAQKRAQAAIVDSERRYREIFESAGVALWAQDFSEVRRFLEAAAPAEELRAAMEGDPTILQEAARRIRVEDVNAETLRLFSIDDKHELLGAVSAVLVPESYDVLREQLLAHTLGERRFSSETVVQTVFGDRRDILISSVVPPQEPSWDRALISMIDITERKSLEAQLRHAQKMEAVGQLAGGIAHDFNNLLAVILGRSEILAKRLPPDEELQGHVALIRETVSHAASLTSRLLAFSRRQVLQPRLSDLNAIVAETVGMLQRLIDESVTLELCLATELGLVRVDPGQISQLVLNLALNARDAMPSGGTIVIETANQDGGLGVPSVVLRIRDEGHGMDEATKARIFEPFFTTKASGEGSGLGLATVYGIVEQSGGSIRVESAPGRGAAFEVFLPRAAPSQREAPRPAEGRPRGGDETVLVLEDEPAVREVAALLLSDHGYRVLTAADGEEALRIAADHDGPIHLLLSDVVMPGMRGPELAARVEPLRPEIRLLYMSGYTPDQSELGGAQLLQKPFTAHALLAAVRQTLDGAPRLAAR